MKPVAQILQTKDIKTVYTISPEASVLDAMKMMAERRVGALLVKENDGDKIIGVVSERDFARKVALMGRTADKTSVCDVMSSPVMYVRPEQTNEECMALMTENRFRHLPVMSDGKLVGLISIGDLVKDIISEQKFIIDQLEHYIRGDRC